MKIHLEDRKSDLLRANANLSRAFCSLSSVSNFAKDPKRSYMSIMRAENQGNEQEVRPIVPCSAARRTPRLPLSTPRAGRRRKFDRPRYSLISLITWGGSPGCLGGSWNSRYFLFVIPCRLPNVKKFPMASAAGIMLRLTTYPDFLVSIGIQARGGNGDALGF